jgi:hypothetical protein
MLILIILIVIFKQIKLFNMFYLFSIKLLFATSFMNYIINLASSREFT